MTKDDSDSAAGSIKQKLERAERDAAIARAGEAEAKRRSTTSAAEAQRFRAQAESAQAVAITSTVSGLEQQRDKLKADLATALADGDFPKASDLQFQMSEVASKLTAASAQKDYIEKQSKETKDTKTGDGGAFDKEAYLAAKSVDSAAWLRAHDQFFTDPKYQARVSGAHNLAIGKNIPVDTPEYFRFIEETIGDGDGSGDGARGNGAGRKETKRDTESFGGAPPSRDAGGTGGRKLQAGDRYIPPDMVDYATRVCNVTPEQYYDEYKTLVEAGTITDRFHVFGR